MAPLRGANYLRCVLKLIKRRGVVVFLEGVNEGSPQASAARLACITFHTPWKKTCERQGAALVRTTSSWW
jgi:hypothetical protein